MKGEQWHELNFGAVLTRNGEPVRISSRRKRLPSAAVTDTLIRDAERIVGPVAVGRWRYNRETQEWEAPLTR